jgi:hypothetical protein
MMLGHEALPPDRRIASPRPDDARLALWACRPAHMSCPK